MKFLLLFFAGMFFTFNGFSQIDREPIPAEMPDVLKPSDGNVVFGKVVDIQTGKPIEYVSVQLMIRKRNEVTGNTSDSLIRAMLTKSNGYFSFNQLPVADTLSIELSAIGFGRIEKIFSFSSDDQIIQKDLGNIVLAREAEKLETVTIVGSRPALRMGIDKKIFDVDKSITSKGGTAEDVMKNIPSVSVDVDGNIELRNSSPTIFIDGRPTILTLDQIPSENIDRVELITNPSAKYDASSSGGIINIILKKNKRTGINGMVSVTAGSQGVFNTNANLNMRQGKFNFFVSGNHSESAGKSKGNSFRENKVNEIVENYFDQKSINNRGRNFNSIRFGVDYFLDNRNTLSITQGIRSGRFNNRENQTQNYFDKNKNLERYGDRNSSGNFQFDRKNTRLDFTHKFPTDGKELTASVNFNYGDVKDHTDIINTFYFPDGSLYENPNVVRNDGANKNNQVTAKIDYENQIGENKKIEMGLRSYVNNYESYFNSFNVKNGAEIKLPLSNNYKYQEQVHAAYVTYTGTLKSIGYQIGLRGEYSKFDGTLIDSAQKFGFEYPSRIKNIWDALFPSIYLSRKINETDEIQLNYSRRVRRPNFWQLNPFIDINDPLNIQQGNPGLKPEFRNSLEFNYSKDFKGGSNFLGVLYLRNTQGNITRYSDTLTSVQYDQLNNAAVDPNAILNTFINSKSSSQAGMELTIQQKITANFDITPSASFSYRKVVADVGNLNLSNKGFDWNGKITANYKVITKNPSNIFNKVGMQLSGGYRSPRVIPQGKRLENFSADFAVKKDFLKNDKATFTFSVNDLFDSQRFGVIYDTDNFYQETYRRRSVRGFRVSLSYKFGDANFSLFKKSGGGGNGDNGYDS
jgi:outer membrane receptor protein involved in Fe transport